MALLPQNGASLYPKTLSSPLLDQIATFGTGKYTISGFVRDENSNLISREVIAVNRSTGVIYDRTFSRTFDGAYTLRVPNIDCVVYCLPLLTDLKNAEVADNVTPSAPVA